MSTASWQSWCAMTATLLAASYVVKLRGMRARERTRAAARAAAPGRALAQHAHGCAVQLRGLRQDFVDVQDASGHHVVLHGRSCPGPASWVGSGPRGVPTSTRTMCGDRGRPLLPRVLFRSCCADDGTDRPRDDTTRHDNNVCSNRCPPPKAK